MIRLPRAALVVLALVLAALPTLADRYVDKNDAGCTDLGPGTPPVPFCTIQRGYNAAADGETVYVAPGVYGECLYLYDLAHARSVRLVASAWLDSPPDNTVTVIDGALSGACTFPGSTNSASQVNIAGSGGSGSSIEGFTIRHATNSGIFGVGSVAITHNVVRDNDSLSYGGGIYLYTANCYYGDTVSSVSDNVVVNNRASQGGGGVAVAAGLRNIVLDPDCRLHGDSTVTIQQNLFDGNTAQASGGGINVTSFTASANLANVIITRNTITGNSAGSAVEYGYGGGAYSYTYGYGAELIQITDNTVRSNTAADLGGGISVSGVPTSTAASIYHRTRVEGNEVTENTAERGGGGMEMFLIVQELNGSQTVELEATANSIVGNRVSLDNALGQPNYRGGGGITAQFYALWANSPNLGVSIERNDVRQNRAKIYGGGVSVRSVAETDLRGRLPPARASVDVVGNLIAQNDASSAVTEPSGGGVFVYLAAEGDATASTALLLNTIAANTLDGAATLLSVEPAPTGVIPERSVVGRAGLATPSFLGPGSFRPAAVHVETFTLNDVFWNDGLASLRQNSSIIADNDGVGLGGPIPGSRGLASPEGGTANASLESTYSDVFGNLGGAYEPWIFHAVGDIEQDPLFADPTGDFHLTSGSPVIDRGDPALPPDAPATDLDGDPRVADGNGDGIAVVDMGSDEYALHLLVVGIDIHPGGTPNSINVRSRGVIPVAILGSAQFDVITVDVATLRFGPGEAPPAHDLQNPTTYMDHLQDVNGDGFLDLVVHFHTQESGFTCGDSEATLTGETTAGMELSGTDSIRTVGCRGAGSRTPWEAGETPSNPTRGRIVEIDR